MNPLEKNVASLEACREMEKIDFGETIYSWYDFGQKNQVIDRTPSSAHKKDWIKDGVEKFIPAPTIAEMLDRLPYTIEKNKVKYYLQLSKTYCEGDVYSASYPAFEDENMLNDEGYNTHINKDYFIDKSPAEALSKLCLWCYREGYL